MSRWRRSLTGRLLGVFGMIATVFVFGLGASPARARLYQSIEVVVEPQPAMEGTPLELRSGGYIEHRIVVRNLSKTVDHTVRLVHPARLGGFYNDYLQRNSKTVQVAHESRLVVSLFQPSLPVLDENLAVEIDGSRQKDFVELPYPFSMGFGYSYGMRPALLVLASRGIPQDLKDEVRGAHPNEISFCRSELPVGEWSANWLGYTAYDVLLLTEQEAASLPAAVLLAVRRFVEAGGILLVQGSSPESETIVPDALRDLDDSADDEGAFHIGFGLARPCPETTPWPVEFWAARAKGAIAPQDREVQVVTQVSVPVRGLLVVVILFAVGVGPVNVWLLSRRNKRMWLWWNVPAISLATCLAVFVYSLFSEGISGRGRTALITLLDENTHRATTLGYASYYCPLTPSDGLRFSYDTEVTQLPTSMPSGPRFNSGRPKTVDWTSDQHLDSGWVVARVPACFAIRKSEPRRERLTFQRGADGAVSVVNGLGVDIDSLYYLDENGVASEATELPAGAKRTLEARKSKGEPTPEATRPLRAVFDNAWNNSLRELKANPEKYLTPGCYIAVVQQSPFLEDPLVAAPQNGSTGVIYGIGARSGNGR